MTTIGAKTGLAILAAMCLAAPVLAAAADLAPSTVQFDKYCFDKLEDFDASVARAESDGWTEVAAGASPVADAILRNYADKERYRDVKVLASSQAGEQFLLAFVAGLESVVGDMAMAPINACRLIDLSATGTLDKYKFEANYNPFIFEKYTSFTSIRQVYYASPEAPPEPLDPVLGERRSKIDLRLTGLVLTSSRFTR